MANNTSKGRVVLITAGLLIAAGALFLLARGFRGAAAAGQATPAPEETAAGPADGGKAGDKAPPEWQSFLRPDERKTPPRPVLRVAQGLPDPFDRLPGAGSGGGRRESPQPPLRLEGISIGAQPVALLSGRAVRVGDTVSGYRVARIDRSAVTLAGPQGARHELSLREDRPESGGGR